MAAMEEFIDKEIAKAAQDRANTSTPADKGVPEQKEVVYTKKVVAKEEAVKEIIQEEANKNQFSVEKGVEKSPTPANKSAPEEKQEGDQDEDLEIDTPPASWGGQQTLPSGRILLGEDDNTFLEKFLSLYSGK
jgi:hypothetical protein